MERATAEVDAEIEALLKDRPQKFGVKEKAQA